MNCFYAPHQPAIGICKSCGKGLSAEYATDLGHGLACKDSCEERVQKINAMIDSNSQVLSVSNLQLRRNAIFSVASGLLFLLLGYFTGLPEREPPAVLFASLGVVFVIRGIFSYTKSARYPSLSPQDR